MGSADFLRGLIALARCIDLSQALANPLLDLWEGRDTHGIDGLKERLLD